MKRVLLIAMSLILMGQISWAQKPNKKKDKAYFKTMDFSESYYYSTILKGINEYKATKKTKKPYRRLKVDLSGQSFPTTVADYKQVWHNPPISQGNTGTCWDFSTTSFFESEVYRLTGQKVKLSEMYVAYWEYVEKVREYVRTRGTSIVEEGSESNAVNRIYNKYGVVPESVYNGLLEGQKFYTHEQMMEEIKAFLKSVKDNNMWNESFVIGTVKDILNTYMGVPPTEFTYNGKKMTPKQYFTDVLKLNMDNYVDVLSYKQAPFYEYCAYDVPDNWWHSDDYFNVHVDDFMKVCKEAVKQGYSFVIGGDVSEPGLMVGKGEPQVAIIPTFDIPFDYINDDSRAFRFANKTTTDDHGMHVVGYIEKDGWFWFLVKDSSSGSRNNVGTKKFGYYFFREDYLKLKIMDIQINKQIVKKILKNFKDKK